MAEEEKKKTGRPKKTEIDPAINESTDRLIMEGHEESPEEKTEITVDSLSEKYRKMLSKYDQIARYNGARNTMSISMGYDNDVFNPYIQNTRLKKLFTFPQTLEKADLVDYVKDVGNHELSLRAATQSLSGSTYVYYKILREAADIPAFKHYVVPPKLEPKEYKSKDFEREQNIINEWVDEFNLVNSFKKIALEVKKSGKEAYVLRQSFEENEKGKIESVNYCQLQKLPSDYVKITYINKLGYGCAFNMMYFCTPGADIRQFPDFIQKSWAEMNEQGIISENKKKQKLLELNRARTYKPNYKGKSLGTMIEKGDDLWAFWVTLPLEAGTFVFGSDTSTPFQAPDTAGMLLDLQNLTSYGNVAGLLSTLPLNSLFTAEAEIVPSSGVGKTGTYVAADVLDSLNAEFDERIGSNGTILSYIAPLKNMQLHSLADSSAANSSEVLTSSLRNFLSRTGASATIISTDKPSIYQIKVATKLLASQYDSVTRQFEAAINYCFKNLLGLPHVWKIKIFGNSLFLDDDKAFLKECVNGGAVYLLPKLMACEDLSYTESESIVNYLESTGIYKKFMTPTMLKNAELTEAAAAKAADNKEEAGSEGKQDTAGRPKKDDPENDNTAASQDRGDDVGEIKNEYARMSAINEDTKCLICHKTLDYKGQKICEECQEEYDLHLGPNDDDDNE